MDEENEKLNQAAEQLGECVCEGMAAIGVELKKMRDTADMLCEQAGLEGKNLNLAVMLLLGPVAMSVMATNKCVDGFMDCNAEERQKRFGHLLVELHALYEKHGFGIRKGE